MAHALGMALLVGLLLGFALPSEGAALPPDAQDLLDQLHVPLALTERPAWPAPPGRSVRVTLLPQVDHAGAAVVSFGLPFGPAWLTEETRLRVTDERGQEVPTYTRALARWWSMGQGDSLRSVLVQCELTFPDRTPRAVTITWDRPRTLRRAAAPVADTQVVPRQEAWGDADRYLAFDYRLPRVLAVLPAEWLCASLLAWQQVPVADNTAAPWFDQHLAASFPGSLPNLSAKNYSAHLFDRPATYLKCYVRTGDAEQLRAGLEAVDFYLQHLGEDGFFDLKPQPDVKYVFTEGFALAYFLTGDARYREGLARARQAWETHTGLEYHGEGFWTERHHGFGMLAYLHAYEVTGEAAYLAKAKRYFEAAWSLQVHPLPGGAPDGAWLHTRASHSEGGAGWMTSPWMSAFLCDAIWKYWMLTGDPRAPASLAAYAAFTLRHSLSEDGRSVVYLASPPGRGESQPEARGSHNMEGCYLLALGHYLTRGQEPGFREAMARLWPPMLAQDPNSTARMFTWRFREASMLVWFLQH